MWGAYPWGEPYWGQAPDLPAIVRIPSYIYMATVPAQDRGPIVSADVRVVSAGSSRIVTVPEEPRDPEVES